MSRHRAGAPEAEREAAVLDAAVPGALGAELRARGDRSTLYRVIEADGSSVVVKLIAAGSLGVVERISPIASEVPGLVPVLRSGVHDGVGYLVMPYLPIALADLIDGTPLPAGDVARLLGPVADALARLHDAGLVHGDIKPANLLLAGAGGPVQLGDVDEMVEHGTVPDRFSAGFAAPEWAGGAPAAPAADTYGFAATVATALLGGTHWMCDPGEPADPVGSLERLLPESLPVAVRAAITLGLSEDPAARVVTVSGIVAALAASDNGSEDGRVPNGAPAKEVTRRVLTPVRAAGRGDGTPYPADHQTVPPAASPAAADAATEGPRADELVLVAQQVWGFVDLRAATLDRLPLQVQPPAVELDLGGDDGDRSIWRHPAMITSLVLAATLVVLSVLLLML